MSAPPRKLILVTGLPGSGKTTFARALADRLGARHYNTDIIRHELGMLGQYDLEDKKRIYDQLLASTADSLRSGKVVIVDATFYRDELRQPFLELAAGERVPVKWIYLEAKEKVIRERMQTERAYSEADFDVYLKIRNQYEPLRSVYLHVPTDFLPLEALLQETMAYLL